MLIRWVLTTLIFSSSCSLLASERADWLYSKKYFLDAFDEYTSSAKQGDAHAQAKLALMYLWGRGTRRNDALAYKWSLLSAKQDNRDGQHLVGYLYEKGLAVPKNIRLAISWYQKASEQGNLDATANLAGIYLLGKPRYRNKEKGVQLAKRSAKSGNRHGQYLTGYVYQTIFNDSSLANHWYTKAAEQGSTDAANALALHYFHERETATSLSDALFWTMIAEEYNSPQAHQNRMRLQNRVTPEVLAKTQSAVRAWLNKHSH